MISTAFLFPGQGSQSLGMLQELAAEAGEVRETFSEASGALGYDLWKVCQQGPEEKLNRTELTQPAMLAAGIATWRTWQAQGGGLPEVFAGHSLGEYTALVAAGALNFQDAVSIVAERGRLMQAATPEGIGAMAAVLGLEDDTLESICNEYDGEGIVSCANFNAPGQVVIAGNKPAVAAVCEMATEAGARRAIVLPVSVPSHCLLMQPAAGKLREHLDGVDLLQTELPVIQNADVKSHLNPDDIRDALARQLWQPVRWTATIQSLIANRVARFVECGPGRVLAGLNRRISRESENIALTDMEAIRNAL